MDQHSPSNPEDETQKLLQWVAGLNLEINNNRKDQETELMWFPVKIQEDGQYELIVGDDKSLHMGQMQQSNSSFKFHPSPDLSQHFKHSNIPKIPLDAHAKSFNEDKTFQVDIEEKLDVEVISTAHRPSTPVSSLERGHEHGEAEESPSALLEVEQGDIELAVEAEEDLEILERNKPRWRILLSLLIIFIMLYQVIDRYYLYEFKLSVSEEIAEDSEPEENPSVLW